MDVSEIIVLTVFAVNLSILLFYIIYGVLKENRRQEQYERQEEQQEAMVSVEVVINIGVQPEEEAKIKEIAAGCTECAVCLGDYESDQNGVARSTLKCGHRFHKVCIDTWFKNAGACPICRVVSAGDFSVSFHGLSANVQGS